MLLRTTACSVRPPGGPIIGQAKKTIEFQTAINWIGLDIKMFDLYKNFASFYQAAKAQVAQLVEQRTENPRVGHHLFNELAEFLSM